jgi:cardiolipin synthase A/B
VVDGIAKKRDARKLTQTEPSADTTNVSKTAPKQRVGHDVVDHGERTGPNLQAPPKSTPGNRAIDTRLGTTEVKQPFGGPAFEAALDEKTKSRAHKNCDAQLLFDGVESFKERNKLIDSATSSIHLQSFIFTDDEAGLDMAKRLAKKAREGVQVRVIVDAFGSQKTSPEMWKMLRDAGVEVRMHQTGVLGANMRWHEKHLIVDGKVSIEGGMNIADEYALGGSGMQILSKHKRGQEPWRDVDVRIEGAAVHDAQRAFLRNWKMLGPPVKDIAHLFPKPALSSGDAEVRVIQHHPAEGEDHTLQLYLHAVRAATKSITIENAYFIPPKELRDALIEAAKRGVEVRVLTNSKESGNHGYCVDAARYWYDEMLRAGIKIFERNVKSTLHAKTATFDGEYSIVGSANLNGRSDGLDTECSICVRHDATAQQLEDRFDDGLQKAREITLRDVENDSFVTNVRKWMFSSLSWTL